MPNEQILNAVIESVTLCSKSFAAKDQSQVRDLSQIWMSVIEDVKDLTPEAIRAGCKELLQTFEGFFPAPATFRKSVAKRAEEHRRVKTNALLTLRLANELPANIDERDSRSTERIRAEVRERFRLADMSVEGLTDEIEGRKPLQIPTDDNSVPLSQGPFAERAKKQVDDMHRLVRESREN